MSSHTTPTILVPPVPPSFPHPLPSSHGYSTRSHARALAYAVNSTSGGPSHCSSLVSSTCTPLLSSNPTEASELNLHKELALQASNISIISHQKDALAAHVCGLELQLELSDARHQVSDAHAMISNLKTQELHCQLAEKTGTCKKCKINMEGCVIDSVALFVQQDTECWVKEMADESKKNSKTDAVQSREHQCLAMCACCRHKGIC